MTRTTPGRILLCFTKEQIEAHDKTKGGLIIVNHKNPADYSIEVARVAAVNDRQEFYKPGDTVLVHYIVFTDGRSNMVKSQSRRVERLPNGDEIYWAFDGTDGRNQPDVYCRVVPYTQTGGHTPEYEMTRGLIMLSPPPPAAERKIGLLYAPATVEQEGKYVLRDVVAIHPDDSQELSVYPGDRVCVEKEFVFEVKAEGESFWMVRDRYLVYRQRPTAAEYFTPEEKAGWSPLPGRSSLY